MKNTHALARLLCLCALLCTHAAAQKAAPRKAVPRKVTPQKAAPQTKHFSEKGLSFDYPSGLTMQDKSAEDVQQLILKQGGGAQIMVLSRFDRLESQEQFDAARRAIVDTFADESFVQLNKLGKAERKDAQIEVAGVQARGTRLRAVLATEPGAVEIYSLLLGKRLVMVSIIGTDKELAAAAGAWALVRASLRVSADDASTTGAVNDGAALPSRQSNRPRS